MDKLREKAAVLKDLSKYTGKSELNDILAAMTTLKEIYPKMNELVMTYHKLAMEASKCKDQLDDYMLAKVVERTNILEDVNRRKQEMADRKAAQALQQAQQAPVMNTKPKPKPAPAPAQQRSPRSQQHSHQYGQAPNNNSYNQSHPQNYGSNFNQQPTYGSSFQQNVPGYPSMSNDLGFRPGGFQPTSYGFTPSTFGGPQSQFGAPQQNAFHGTWGNNPNPYMNRQYPPWYNPNNPGQGPPRW